MAQGSTSYWSQLEKSTRIRNSLSWPQRLLLSAEVEPYVEPRRWPLWKNVQIAGQWECKERLLVIRWQRWYIYIQVSSFKTWYRDAFFAQCAWMSDGWSYYLDKMLRPDLQFASHCKSAQGNCWESLGYIRKSPSDESDETRIRLHSQSWVFATLAFCNIALGNYMLL